MRSIVTHGGPNAHFDELLAIGMLLATRGSIETPVYRREPTTDEIEDPRTAVVDVGGEYDASLLNFDHHQDGGLPSSMQLVAKHLGYHEAMTKAFSWYQFKDWIDTEGPHRTAEAFGIDNIRATQSPVESYVLRAIADVDGQLPRELVKFIEGLGASIVHRAENFVEKLSTYRYEGYVDTVAIRRDVFCLPDREPDSQVLRTLREDLGFEVTVTKDARTGDLAVYRYEDVPQPLDFSWASGLDGVHFAHESGFLATVEDMHTARWVIATAELRSRGFDADTIEERIESLDNEVNDTKSAEEINELDQIQFVRDLKSSHNSSK